MSKKVYRYFGGFLQSQENWLNKMADNGYRLRRVGKLLYEFDECKPGQVRYCVDFIGHKSMKKSKEYHDFLEDIGYRVFYKNINLNYSIGKVRFRPWAQKGGFIATNGTTYNKELLIVEKENDGKLFELHTSYEDKIDYYRTFRKAWLSVALLFILLGLAKSVPLLIAMGLIVVIPIIFLQVQLRNLSKESKIKEL